jgi:hypothetical protein
VVSFVACRVNTTNLIFQTPLMSFFLLVWGIIHLFDVEHRVIPHFEKKSRSQREHAMPMLLARSQTVSSDRGWIACMVAPSFICAYITGSVGPLPCLHGKTGGSPRSSANRPPPSHPSLLCHHMKLPGYAQAGLRRRDPLWCFLQDSGWVTLVANSPSSSLRVRRRHSLFIAATMHQHPMEGRGPAAMAFVPIAQV